MAVDGGDDGPLEPVPVAEDPVDPRDHRALLLRRQRRNQLQVHPTGEELAEPGQHDRSGRIRQERLDQLRSLVEQIGRERVRRRALDVNDGDVPVALDPQEVGHARTITQRP